MSPDTGPLEELHAQILNQVLPAAPDIDMIIEATSATILYHTIGLVGRHPNLIDPMKALIAWIQERIILSLSEAFNLNPDEIERLQSPPSPSSLILLHRKMHGQHIALTLSAFEGFVLIGWLQLVTRHPNLSETMMTGAIAIGQQLQEHLVQVTGDDRLHDIIGLGWNPDHDVPVGED